MANPSNSSVTIDGNRFNALSVQFIVGTHHENDGMPLMGSLKTMIDVDVDIHDTLNVPFTTLQALYDLSHHVTRDKIVPIKIEYWQDEHQDDAIGVYSFDGWIAKFHIASGAGANHTLRLSLQPKLDSGQFVKIDMSN